MFLKLLEKHIKTGILHLHLPGIDYTFGTSGTEAHWHFNDLAVLGRIARDWEFELGKTYVEGPGMPAVPACMRCWKSCAVILQ